jgi:hypothetical protein
VCGQRLAAIGAPSDPTQRAEWDARIAAVRRNFSNTALRREIDLSYRHQENGINSGLVPILNSIEQNPDATERYVADGERLIRSAGAMDATERETRVAAFRERAEMVRQTGLIRRDPAAAAASLGGTTPYFATLRPVESGGDDRAQSSTSSATGRYQFIDGTWNDLANSAEGRAAGLRPIPEGGSRGAADPRFDPEQQERAIRIFTAQNMRTLERAGITPDGRNTYLAHFMGAQGAIDFIREMQRTPNDSASERFPDAAGANRRLFYRADGSARTLREAYETITRRFANTGNPGALAPPDAGSSLPPERRMQLRDQAERMAAQRQQQGDAVVEAQRQQRVTDLEFGIADGTRGRSDVAAARSEGLIDDPQTLARLNRILEKRENDNYYVNRFNTRMAGGAQFNSADPEDRKAVDAAVVERARATDGNTTRAAFDVWQQTGILAAEGARAIRGGVNSQNEQQAVAAYQTAVSMLRSNPNAFAGVEGGSEIYEAATRATGLLSSAGVGTRTMQEVVQRIAAEDRQTPTQRTATRAAAKEFQDTMTSQTVRSAIQSQMSGWFSRPELAPDAATVGVMEADYRAAAESHFLQFGDANRAKTFAAAEVNRLYGVFNNRIMRYPPPTGVYPAIEDARGNVNRNYIIDQARQAILDARGFDVKPEDVQLVPLPFAVTRDAFTQGRPVPYALAFTREDPLTGLRVRDVLLMQGTTNPLPFTADPGKAARAASAERERLFNEQRGRAAADEAMLDAPPPAPAPRRAGIRAFDEQRQRYRRNPLTGRAPGDE